MTRRLNELGIYPQEDTHKDWVSCVRFSPNASNPIIVSCGWDKVVKVMCHYIFDQLKLFVILANVPNDYDLDIIIMMKDVLQL